MIFAFAMGFLDRLSPKKTPPIVASIQPRAPIANYRVQLLLPRPTTLDPKAIHTFLKAWREDVQLIGADPARFAIVIPSGTPTPIVIHVFQAPPDNYPSELRDGLRWSQTWRDRREAVGRARESFVVATRIDPGPAHAAQLLSLLAVIDTVLVSIDERDAAAAVLHWMPAQQVMPCIRYRLLRKELGPSGPAVNIRIAGDDGAILADTIGCAPLGLPDLQVRFCNRDPNEVALQMMLLVKRQFLGEELAGATKERWLAPPARDTLTIELD